MTVRITELSEEIGTLKALVKEIEAEKSALRARVAELEKPK